MRLFSSALTNYQVGGLWGRKTGVVGYLRPTIGGVVSRVSPQGRGGQAERLLREALQVDFRCGRGLHANKKAIANRDGLGCIWAMRLPTGELVPVRHHDSVGFACRFPCIIEWRVARAEQAWVCSFA